MCVAAQNFIGAFAGENDFVASVAHGTAQKVLGHAMGIDAKRFRLQDGIGEMVGEIVLPNGDGIEVGAGFRRHLARFFFFVVVSVVEGEGEGANRFGVMFCGEAEDGAGVEASAEIATDGNIGAQTDADGFFEDVAELGGVVGVGALRGGVIGGRVIKIPIAEELDVLLGGDQVVAGRDLVDSIIKRAHLMTAEFDRVVDGFGVPASGYSGGEQGFHFRCEIERVVVEGVEQGLDAEAVASGEESAVGFIPENDGEFAAQPVQALWAKVFIKVQSDFAVGSGAQAVARLLQFPLDRFIAVEFAVDDDVGLAVLAGDGLIAGGEVDDAETRVAEGDAAVGRYPVALAVGAAMVEALGGAVQDCFRDGLAAREERDYSAHACAPWFLYRISARW